MSIAENLEELPNLTDSEKALLDARLAAYRKDPDAGSSREDIEARLLAKLDG